MRLKPVPCGAAVRSGVARQLAGAAPQVHHALLSAPPQERGYPPRRAGPFCGAARSLAEPSDAVAAERELIAAGRAHFEAETQVRARLFWLRLRGSAAHNRPRR